MNKDIVLGRKGKYSTVIYKKECGKLIKGLQLNDGTICWFDVSSFGDFYCGLAMIDNGEKTYYINRNGQTVIDGEFSLGGDFTENRAFMVGEKSETILIDKKGSVIKVFDEPLLTYPFSNGLARVSRIIDNAENKTSGYIDRSGKLIIPFIEDSLITCPYDLFDEEELYSDGLIRIKVNDKYGFIDINLNVIIPFEYDWASRFNHGIAAIAKDSRYGFINKKNEEVVPFIYDYTTRFNNGIAFLKNENTIWAFNKNGEAVRTFEYQSMNNSLPGGFCFKKNGKWGLMDRRFQIIFNPEFDRIINFSDGILRFMVEDKEGVCNTAGDKLICDTQYLDKLK